MKTLRIEELKGVEVFGDNPELTRLRQIVQNSRKTVIISGAGISVSAGIPDFRSAEGLYARALSNQSTCSSTVSIAKGKDLFDSSFFYNPKTKQLGK
jgi:NAD-dependent histone deacetylase SIR2